MWPYSWTHVGTPSHLGHMDRVASTMPSQAHAGAAQEAPNIGQWEGQDVPLVRHSSCTVKRGNPELPKIPTYLPYLPTYLPTDSSACFNPSKARSDSAVQTRAFLDPVLVSSRLPLSMVVMGAAYSAYILIYPEY